MKKRILSGMRPTGKLHLGNYFGAIKNWVNLQDKYECFFMVADWHALMSEYGRPEEIKDNSIDNVIDWMSCGLDPQRSVIFVQSHIKEHLQLDMVLSVLTPLSWLERCPTYKEQLREMKTRDLTTYGFLGYPVLQAADILVYKANAVPVGADQLAHLEITREIARRFNNLYKKEVFPDPEPILTECPKLLGTDNRKMSKSYDNTILLSESPDIVKKKIYSMITDEKKIKMQDSGRPDVCNVFGYYKVFNPGLLDEITSECKKGNLGCVEDKKRLADALIEWLRPMQEERKKLLENKDYVYDVLKKGDRKAAEAASETIEEVKKIIGLLKE